MDNSISNDHASITAKSATSYDINDSGSFDENRIANDSKNSFTTKEPSENDVLCGRGGSINSHPGNERFRILVEKRKRVYLTARFKREKRLIASSIVSEISSLHPPGRFLSRDTKSGLWVDIGEEKARDKTSQALRENAPSIRAEIETEINKHRADMQQRDDVHAASKVAQPIPAAIHPPYLPTWGYLYYSYGYPPHPPPSTVSYQPQTGMGPPHPPPGHYDPYYHSYGTTPDPYLHPPTPKSAIEQTAQLVSSHAESFKNWTKRSLSFGGGGGGGVSTAPSNEGSRSQGTKPISYKHDDGLKRRRMVKFRDDDSSQNTHQRVRRVRPCYSPLNGNDSLVDNLEDDENDLEPHRLDTIHHQDTSLMAQVANYLTPTVGSWDLATIVCGHDTSDSVPFPRSSSGTRVGSGVEDGYYEDDEAVEWEGQEVQLVDESKKVELSEKRYPPDQQARNDNGSSIAFSSLGSCHSWLPENFGSAASYFSSIRGVEDDAVECGSMEMDYSAGGGTAGDYSAGGSLGGNSLCRVFENEAYEEGLPLLTSPNMNARILSRVPSWERSLRSKSPLSIGSDDESLVSKSSSKYEDEPISPVNFHNSGIASAMHSIDEEDCTWTKE